MQGEQVEIEVYEPKNGDWAGNVDLDVSVQARVTPSVKSNHLQIDTLSLDWIPTQKDREPRGV